MGGSIGRNLAGRERFVSSGIDGLEEASCAQCRHKHLGKATCTAFPLQIPQEILDGHVSHRRPYVGDGGVHFEPLEEEDAI